jgi:hypothetical protein
VERGNLNSLSAAGCVQKSRFEKDPKTIDELLANGKEASEFIRMHVVQGVSSNGGNFGVSQQYMRIFHQLNRSPRPSAGFPPSNSRKSAEVEGLA